MELIYYSSLNNIIPHLKHEKTQINKQKPILYLPKYSYFDQLIFEELYCRVGASKFKDKWVDGHLIGVVFQTFI